MRSCKCLPHVSKIPRLTDNFVSSDVYTRIKGYGHGASRHVRGSFIGGGNRSIQGKNTDLPLTYHIDVVSSTPHHELH